MMFVFSCQRDEWNTTYCQNICWNSAKESDNLGKICSKQCTVSRKNGPFDYSTLYWLALKLSQENSLSFLQMIATPKRTTEHAAQLSEEDGDAQKGSVLSRTSAVVARIMFFAMSRTQAQPFAGAAFRRACCYRH